MAPGPRRRVLQGLSKDVLCISQENETAKTDQYVRMMQEQLTHDRFLDLKHLVDYSGLGRSTLKKLIASGQIPAYAPTGKLLVKLSDYNAFVERHRVQAFDKVAEIVDGVMAEIRNAK